jgi:hypothetical protein
MALTEQTIEPFYRGETVILNFTMDPVEDITAQTLRLTVAAVRDMPQKALTATATITDGPAGEFQFTLTATQTNLPAGAYQWDVWLLTENELPRLVALGTLTVASDVRLPA